MYESQFSPAHFVCWLKRSGLLLALLAFGSVGRAQPDYPPALWSPAFSGHWYTGGNGHSFCVIHDMEGYYESTVSYFQQPTQGGTNSYASAHFCVNGMYNGDDTAHSHTADTADDGLPGEITQMVREQYYAWHALCLNTYSYGTEHEGFVNSPVWYTEGMYQASAGLQRHLCAKSGIPMDRNHIIGHNEWQNASWTNWMKTNWPDIDPSCNTHTDPGQYWDWTHFMALVTSNTPTISAQPINRSVDQNSNVTFTVTAGGVTPLTYRWRFNGTIISGATASAYTIGSAQVSNIGSYSVIISNASGASTSTVVQLMVLPAQAWYTNFSDNFNTNSAGNWNLFQASGNGTSDYTTNWAFDYSATTYTFNGVSQNIPVAPSTTDGTLKGLKITVNKNDATASVSGVSLYPKSQSFSNNYRLLFDMWMNYAGSSGGGTGSTEYPTFGINHTGTRINWGAGTASVSDGLWFAVDGEGGAGSDYLAYVGNPAGVPTALSFAASGMTANGAQTNDASADPFFNDLFPSSTYETPNSPGKHWVQGEVSQINGWLTWKLNGVVVAQRTNTSAYTSGNVMIGYMDIFSSIASPAQDNYVIFDNVRVLSQAVAPVITLQPTNRAVNIGANTTFTAGSTGTPAPTYQWYRTNTPIAGATNSSYTRTNIQTGDAGNYSVTAGNPAASVTSSNAVLGVTQIQQVVPQFIGGSWQVKFTGAPGTGYAVLASSNLVDWITLALITNTTGTVIYNDSSNTNGAQRFYRISAPK